MDRLDLRLNIMVGGEFKYDGWREVYGLRLEENLRM